MGTPKLANLALWGDATQYSEGRAYRHPVTGERYPSVTTVLKLVDKSGLAQWAADQAMLWAAENWQFLGRRSEEQAFNAGRYRWKDIRDERAEVGTGVHETIEALHKGSWNFPALTDEQAAIMKQWEILNETHTIEPILSEFTMFDTETGYAGTADGYWRVTCNHDGPTHLGKPAGVPVLTLVDVKTSRSHWPEHDYQLGALWSAPDWALEVADMEWEITPRRPIETAAIIHLRADKAEIIEVPALDLQASVFRSYVHVWKARQDLKTGVKQLEDEALAAIGFAA